MKPMCDEVEKKNRLLSIQLLRVLSQKAKKSRADTAKSRADTAAGGK